MVFFPGEYWEVFRDICCNYINFVVSESSTPLQKMLSIKVLLMGVTPGGWVITRKHSDHLIQKVLNWGKVIIVMQEIYVEIPMIYGLLFGSSDEMIVSKAAVKFSLISKLRLYTNSTVNIF